MLAAGELQQHARQDRTRLAVDLRCPQQADIQGLLRARSPLGIEREKLLALKNVTVEYANAVPLFDLSFDFLEPVTVVLGPSGSGKSTLLRVIAGLQEPDSGAVHIGTRQVAKPSWSSAGDTRVALVHQDYRLIDFLTVEQNLRLAAELRSLDPTNEETDQVLKMVGLSSDFGPRLPGTLSGGEQQRVAIARALLCDVEVLLADEPTGALDLDNTSLIAELLREVGEQSGIQVVIATHDPVVAAISSNRYVLVNGGLKPE